MAVLDGPDLNVWHALIDSDHQHHGRARYYWDQEALPEIAFSRITMLGLLRLLTNSKVIAGSAFSIPEAWNAYEAFTALPEIRFIEDSLLAEQHFARWSKSPLFAAHRWTDAWIAAIAHSAGARGVSGDGDFSTFDDHPFLHLNS